MATSAQSYFNSLRSYLNTAHYQVTETDNGRIVMKEKIFPPGGKTQNEQKVRLVVDGEALVINLDVKKSRNSNQAFPLFHFLDDNAKPWSKRCDFVIFQRYKQRLNAICFEFKSASLPDSLVDQLKASESWCRSLHSTIKHYTGRTKALNITKFVLSCHPDPSDYLDKEGEYLLRDHTIRHYNYSDIDGLSISDLENTNGETIR
jgi:hypothetical protein